MFPSSYMPKKKPAKKVVIRQEVSGEDEDADDGDYEGQEEDSKAPRAKGTSLTKRAEKILTGKFGDKASVIVEQLEFGVSDGITSLITRSLLQSLVEILPITEKNVRHSKGQRGVYQFNQCVSQIRELLTDIQAAKDKGLLGQSIVERYLRPSFLDISVQIVTAMAELEAYGKNNLDNEQRKEIGRAHV